MKKFLKKLMWIIIIFGGAIFWGQYANYATTAHVYFWAGLISCMMIGGLFANTSVESEKKRNKLFSTIVTIIIVLMTIAFSSSFFNWPGVYTLQILRWSIAIGFTFLYILLWFEISESAGDETRKREGRLEYRYIAINFFITIAVIIALYKGIAMDQFGLTWRISNIFIISYLLYMIVAYFISEYAKEAYSKFIKHLTMTIALIILLVFIASFINIFKDYLLTIRWWSLAGSIILFVAPLMGNSRNAEQAEQKKIEREGCYT